MKATCKIVGLLLFALPAVAQVSNPSIIPVSVAPSGACTSGLPNQQVTTTGVQYSCQSGTWGAIGGGSGSGTVNSGTAKQIAYYAGTGAAVSGNSALLSTTADSLYLSPTLPTSPGTNNVVTGVQSGANIFHSGSTWFGGNNALFGMQAGKNLTSAADNTLVGYQAGYTLQGGFSTGCTPAGSSEEDGIVDAFGENAAAALNTPTSGGCEISSSFFGQKAGGSLLTSYNDAWQGTHAGTGVSGITASNSTSIFGAWAGSTAGATTATTNYDTFIGARTASSNAGGTLAHDTGVGYGSLKILDGTAASTADWNSALGDSSGCSITTGRFNTFLGGVAGGSSTCVSGAITGTYNIGVGYGSVSMNAGTLSGTDNIVMGSNLATNPPLTGAASYNLLLGSFGHNVSTATYMTMVGTNWNVSSPNGSETKSTALGANTTIGGSGQANNTALGANSTASGGSATAVGYGSAATAVQAISVGFNSTATQSSAIAIGQQANATAVNAIELGVGTCSISAGVCLYGKQLYSNSTQGTMTLSLWQPTTLFSAAGTALPTCNSGAKGTMAVVSDATAPTYHGTYTSGGAVVSGVICDGTNWVTD